MKKKVAQYGKKYLFLGLRPIDELTEDEFANILQCNYVAHEFLFFHRKQVEIVLNHEQYFQTYRYYESKLSNNFDHDTLNLSVIDINRVFINFITSLKTFPDLYEKRLKEKYSSRDQPVKRFEKIKQRWYDSSFAYRLLYNLRNFSQHVYAYPIDNFKHELESNSGTFAVAFDKANLLMDNKLRKKMAEDLKKYAATFPIKPIMNEISSIINEFTWAVAYSEESYFEQHMDVLGELSHHSLNQEHDLTFGERLKVENNLDKISARVVATEIYKIYTAAKSSANKK